MSLIKLKPTVVVPKVVVIACAVSNAANSVCPDKDMLITSGNDSAHMPGSKHYVDRALDFRTKHLTAGMKQMLVVSVRRRLGPDYDVILEDEGGNNEHLHIEWDPK